MAKIIASDAAPTMIAIFGHARPLAPFAKASNLLCRSFFFENQAKNKLNSTKIRRTHRITNEFDSIASRQP